MQLSTMQVSLSSIFILFAFLYNPVLHAIEIPKHHVLDHQAQGQVVAFDSFAQLSAVETSNLTSLGKTRRQADGTAQQVNFPRISRALSMP